MLQIIEKLTPECGANLFIFYQKLDIIIEHVKNV